MGKCNFSSFPLTRVQNYSRKHVQSEIAQHFVTASIKNTQENACKTLLAEQPRRKSWENWSKIAIQLWTVIKKLRFLVHTRAKRSPRISLTANYAKYRRKINENQKGVGVPRRCLKRETCAESGQNAIHVEETLPRQSQCDMCQEKDVCVLRMRCMSRKRALAPQNATFVDKTESK